MRVTMGGMLVVDGLAAPVRARPPIRSHRNLTAQVSALLGTGRTLRWVHPHPRVSRLVCLWTGNMKWMGIRSCYKILLATRSRRKATVTTKVAQNKWTDENHKAAHGLDKLQWASIRRTVGLNPWGEQLLYRIKQHARSTYNPVSAGMSCPHAICVRVGKVDLFQNFWACPVAHRMRQELVPK
ncbi:hypothetical protein PF005_g9008 [Phytophthora fragariae]|uniref:Uncharacterized protein n=1 Tax=Phytophthora fragariae TaxID=53985 RepID=A0A6A4DN22_9STRA|nr:hypothetical protein PF003_g11442 [Phytophthora fragariae]KAE8940196.1 hypothetical protein PF009_g9992 [Phytophthora fragariae]KAE9014692.1 hypothetical protein PF011_g7946 [Phytophthora fragariae]KAE9118983.1 hypothetical protein PF007_g8727 [Phytophthora fragariae]KAE9145272.1 hypothetical protein PF006_g9865 [Phytophthora fragariae]